MKEAHKTIIDALADNSFVVFADADGAAIYSKLRGVTAGEIGLLVGSLYASMDRQLIELRTHIQRTGGPVSLKKFDDAIADARSHAYDEENSLREQRPERDA
jgi:dihydroxyacetone kinase